MGLIIDELGNKYGKLLVKSMSIKKRKSNRDILWECVCDCGNEITASGSALRAGKIKTCGCSKQDKNTILNRSRKRRIGGLQAAINKFFHNYRHSAKVRKINFNLVKENFLYIVKQNCHYCDTPPSLKIDVSVLDEERVFYFSGVDRLDNNIGYTIENCVPCCSICNRAKSTMSYEDYLIWLAKISQRYNQ